MDGNTTIKEYDDLNREIEIISPEGNEERYIYDGNDNQIRYYDGKGKYTDYQYDSYNRITGVKDAMGNQSSYHYDRQGNLREKINPLGEKEIYDYDEMGRMILEENTQGYRTKFAYDAVGNRTYKRDPNGTESSYQYYPNNLVKEISLSNGEESHKITYLYDEAGETKEVIDGDIISRYNYLEDEDTGARAYTPDPYGRIYQKTDIIDGQSLSTNYRYDIAGRITGIKTPAGEWLEYEYNQLGELQSVPGFVEETKYNSLGLLEEVKAANGLRNSYNYDNNSRIEGISYQNNNDILKDYNISYDSAGNIDSLNNNSYQYDNLNRLIFADLEGKFENIPQEENQVKYRILDDYDGQNSLTQDELIEDKAEIVELDYAAGSIAAGIGSRAQKISRIELKGENIEHRVEERQLSVYYGIDREEFTKIEDYQLIKEIVREGNEEKSKIIILFDQPVEASYIKVKTDFNERDEKYKAVNKAEFYNTAEDIIDIYYYVTERTERYEYDAAGNREKEIIVDWRNSNRDYSYYPNSNQLKSNGDFTYIYDDNGNMIKRGKAYTISGDSVTIASDDEYWEYQYDLLDRLIKVKENGITVAEYTYNHRGLRVKKEDYQATSYYTFNLDDQVIYEQENGEYSEYIYVRGQHFARRDGNLLSSESTSYFYHTDHLGSTVMVTDITAEIVWSSEYTPFGLLAKQEGDYDFQKAEKFTGKDLDQDTGLYYYNARWYYAEIGRFISADSYKGELENSQTLNLYIYTTNNPLIYVDPSGNIPIISVDTMKRGMNLGNEFIAGARDRDFTRFKLQASMEWNQVQANFWSDVVTVSEAADSFGQWSIENQHYMNLIPGYGLGSNIGQGIDRYILGSDYYFQGDRGLLDWASDVGVSGITTILPVEMYGYYKAIGGMAAVKYTFMGDSAVSGGKPSQTTAMKVDSVSGVQGVNSQGFTSTSSKASSYTLRKNMVDSGVTPPEYPNAAHHIVAGNSVKANEARLVLQRYGIDINEPVNGVFLPTVKNVSNATYHPSLHTNLYYNEVNSLLKGAGSRSDAVDILQYISEQLSSGLFPQ